MKTSKQLERHFKGVANHWRIEVLKLVEKNKDMSVEDIAHALGANFRNISQHTHRLVRAGLLDKQYVGRTVLHSLSPYGKKFVKFITTF